jgi:hypothetical protein
VQISGMALVISVMAADACRRSLGLRITKHQFIRSSIYFDLQAEKKKHLI